LALNSDPNDYAEKSHMYFGSTKPNCLQDQCTDKCVSYGEAFSNATWLPQLFQMLGQRKACCQDLGQEHCSDGQGPQTLFPGHSLAAWQQSPVDNLSSSFCGYARNARYTGGFGGVVL